jgi:hypothetical protein
MADDFGVAKVNARGHSSWLMVSLRKTWFSLSIQDPAFFHCSLSYYAGNFYQDLKQPDSGVILQYRTISINLVNERLGNLQYGVSDGTIGTVAGMSLYEVSVSPVFSNVVELCLQSVLTNHGQSYMGTLSSAKLHINGLEQMVNLRGGFQKAQFSMPLQRLLAWYSTSFKMRNQAKIFFKGRSEFLKCILM